MIFNERLESRRLFHAGQPDPLFGTAGYAAVDSAMEEVVVDALPAPDGTTIVATTANPYGYPYDGHTVLRKIARSGVTLDVIHTDVDSAESGGIAVDPLTGRVAVAAYDDWYDSLRVYVYDFSLGGAAPSFGEGGAVRIDPPQYMFRAGDPLVAWQRDGKLVVGTTHSLRHGPSTGDDDDDEAVVVRRFNADGSADTSFGTDGLVQIADAVVPGDDEYQGHVLAGVGVADDGDIVLAQWVAGSGKQTVDLYRLTATGQRDEGFGPGGRVPLYVLPPDQQVLLRDFKVRGDGTAAALFVAYEQGTLGGTQNHLATIRPDGAAGNGFNGVLPLPPRLFDARQFDLTADGKIVVAGNVWDAQDPGGGDIETFVARFNANGTFDTGYGDGGFYRAGTERFVYEPELVVQDDGAALVVNSVTESQIGLLRLQGGDARWSVTHNRKGSLIVTTGDEADDVYLRVRPRDGRLILGINGHAQSFAASKVKRIALFTGGGDDTVTIGAGVRGAYVDGGAGADTLHGGAGDDALLGGDGDDRLFGHDGNDRLLGGDGDDYLLGGAGKDDLFGDDGRDTLNGAGGNDRLFGGAAADACNGGAGDDRAADSEEDAFSGIEALLA